MIQLNYLNPSLYQIAICEQCHSSLKVCKNDANTPDSNGGEELELGIGVRVEWRLRRFWGGFRGSQDQFLGDLAHLVDDLIQRPLVGNGPLHSLWV